MYKLQFSNRKSNSKITAKKMFVVIIFIFILSCFAGYIIETVYALVKHGKYINKQGLIYGPFKPIYGLGGVIFTLVFYNLREKNNTVIFLMGCVIGSLTEFSCSVFQQYVLKSSSWNYSGDKFNIQGRISLIYSLGWGVLAVVFIRLIFPFVLKVISLISENIQFPIAIILSIIMTADILFSCVVVLRHIERLEGLNPSNSFERFLDKHYGSERIESTFTHMRFKYVDKKTKV